MEIIIGIVGLMVAIAAAYIGYLQLKHSAKPVANEGISIDDDSESCLVDIGKINSPTDSIPNAEVRFSFTNITKKVVKITSIKLNVLSYEHCSDIAHPKAAVPIDEYFLHARVKPTVESHELLNKHHEVRDKSEGFFLKVEATEGYIYTFTISILWHFLSKDNEMTTTPEFKITFPMRSAEEMVKILESNGIYRDNQVEL